MLPASPRALLHPGEYARLVQRASVKDLPLEQPDRITLPVHLDVRGERLDPVLRERREEVERVALVPGAHERLRAATRRSSNARMAAKG